METMQELIETVTDAIGSDAYSTRVEPIEDKCVPGFIPFTNGGWNGVCNFTLNSDAGRSVPIINKYVQRDEEECVRCFMAENDIENESDIYDHPDWESYADSWNSDDATWFVYVRACYFTPDNHRNRSGEPEWSLGVAINTDFDYGRDHVAYAGGACNHWIWEREILDSEVTPALLAEMKTEMMKAWQDC